MPKITYIENSGKSHSIEVANGLSVMEGAVQNDIPGIDADCGGGMACATCHVYVKEEWFDKLPKKEDGEEDMLDMAYEPYVKEEWFDKLPKKEDGEEDMLDMAYEPNKFSRLSCQLLVSDELDGLTVSIPSKQG